MYSAEAVKDKNIGYGSLVPADAFLDHEAIRHRSAQFISQVLFNNCPDLVNNQPYSSLLEALRAAHNGDEQAKSLTKTNIQTDVIERTIKAGFVMPKVYLNIDQSGNISQYGQSLDSVHANSLISSKRHQVMLERTKAESENSLRIEQLNRLGVLDDYSMVVFSLAENLPEFGFFTETMSLSIQLVSKEAEDCLSIESAFVAGKQNNHQFDKRVVSELYKQLANIDISGFTPAQIINLPLLVPKSLVDNGVIDLVKSFDDLNNDSFFGLDQPKQDYNRYKQDCYKRVDNYSSTVDKIFNRLLAEANTFRDIYQASQRLGQLSEQYTLVQAVEDKSINPAVFGEIASNHLVHARAAWQSGDMVMFLSELSSARATAVSGSCASVPGVNKDSSVEDQYGSLEFVCPNGHINTREKGELIEYCLYCGVSVRCYFV